MKNIINTIQAPAAIGPYSQAVEINGTLYISGQIPIVPETGKIIEGGIKEQTRHIPSAGRSGGFKDNLNNMAQKRPFPYGNGLIAINSDYSLF